MEKVTLVPAVNPSNLGMSRPGLGESVEAAEALRNGGIVRLDTLRSSSAIIGT